jgi:hypothetical protein
MFSELVRMPKTNAGRYFKGEDIRVIKERITSFGSSAIITDDTCWFIVYWDYEAQSYIVTDCSRNVSFVKKLWSEIV